MNCGGKKRGCRKLRNILFNPAVDCFKPCGMPLKKLETVTLEADELEAVRLIDFEGLYQQDAADKMNISRTTFARTVDSARKKTADAILHGKGLIIKRLINLNEGETL